MDARRNIIAIMKRELGGYFTSPVAYVFLVIFLLLTGFFTFTVGNFFERGEASLVSFFTWHPWLYLFLVPAAGMRLWAEEQRAGTIELLMTLPVPVMASVIGKFLAAWVFSGIALAMTFPMWLTVNFLGSPDNGVIFASYFGSWLMAGAYLSIGSCLSALTNNQVIAFVLSVVVCFMFTIAGHSPVGSNTSFIILTAPGVPSERSSPMAQRIRRRCAALASSRCQKRSSTMAG